MSTQSMSVDLAPKIKPSPGAFVAPFYFDQVTELVFLQDDPEQFGPSVKVWLIDGTELTCTQFQTITLALMCLREGLKGKCPASSKEPKKDEPPPPQPEHVSALAITYKQGQEIQSFRFTQNGALSLSVNSDTADTAMPDVLCMVQIVTLALSWLASDSPIRPVSLRS